MSHNVRRLETQPEANGRKESYVAQETIPGKDRLFLKAALLATCLCETVIFIESYDFSSHP